jgi:hypothetical protein
MIMYLGGGVMVAALSVVALTGNLSTSPQQYYAGSSEQQEGVSDFQQAYIEVDGTEDKQQEEIPQEPTAQIAQSSAGAESLGDVYVSDAQTMALLDASQGENAATTSNAGPSSAQTSASTASVSGADPIEGSVVQAPDVIPFSCVGIDGAVRMVDGVVVISGDIGSQWITEGDVYGFFSFGSQDGSIIYAKGQFEGSVQSGFKIQSSALREHPNATQIILEDVTRENKCEMDIFEFR